jgi:hypothetical protein
VITDAHALALADELYRATCVRMKKQPLEMIGEATFVGGLKVIALYNDDAKLSAVYRVTDANVVEFDGPTLIQVRAKLTHRKVKS